MVWPDRESSKTHRGDMGNVPMRMHRMVRNAMMGISPAWAVPWGSVTARNPSELKGKGRTGRRKSDAKTKGVRCDRETLTTERVLGVVQGR